MPADENGVRVAELDEMSYRHTLWNHQPLTDFWRVGKGYKNKLESNGMYTMGDVALCSIENEDLLYKLFGVNAELLIDHAWGYEPCTIEMVKQYKPQAKSLGTGQVLHCPYDYKKALLIVKEMTDSLALDLCSKGLVTNQLVLTIGYDIENLNSDDFEGEISEDYLGRKIPKHSHGTINLDFYTSSSRVLMKEISLLYNKIINKDLSIRRINIAAAKVILETQIPKSKGYEQLDLFNDYEENQKKQDILQKELHKEKRAQEALLKIKNKYGKNASMKGMNLEEGATMKDRNKQIGGHKA